MERLICSLSGIRGKVGKALTFAQAYRVASYFYEKYLKGKAGSTEVKIILGKDDKKSGDVLVRGAGRAIEDIVKRDGRKIELAYLGVTSTPMLEWAIKNCKAGGGINITASHNPIEWNGIKLFGSDGMLLGREEMEEICRTLMNSGKLEFRAIARKGAVKLPRLHLAGQYNKDVISKVKKTIDLAGGRKGKGKEIFAKIKQCNYKVVIDACSKKSSEIPRRFLIQLGLKDKNIFVINSGSIENSQRKLEPAPPYLGNLKEAVKERKADVGFALDPDQDRLVVMPLKSEEYTLLLCGKFLLELQSHNPRKYIKRIPVNLSTSSAWEDLAADYGIKIIRTKIGEVNVAQAMRKYNCPFGGEGNGGVILGDVNYGRNSTVGMALILAYLAWTGKKIKELEQGLPDYILVKSRVRIASGRSSKAAIDKLISKIDKPIKNVDRKDGYKIFFKDGSWVHLRPSNTEPIIRVFAEAKLNGKRKKTMGKIKGLLKNFVL